MANNIISNRGPFEFFHKIGANSSMQDYAKMCILLSIQPQYVTYYDKCVLIKNKFEERYKGSWRVIIFKQYHGATYGNYKDVYMDIGFEDHNFIILNT